VPQEERFEFGVYLHSPCVPLLFIMIFYSLFAVPSYIPRIERSFSFASQLLVLYRDLSLVVVVIKCTLKYELQKPQEDEMK